MRRDFESKERLSCYTGNNFSPNLSRIFHLRPREAGMKVRAIHDNALSPLYVPYNGYIEIP